MEKYNLQNDVNVFGVQIKTFPKGIGEAFGALFAMLEQKDRAYYGISKFNEKGSIIYWAAAEETFAGEAERYYCEKYIIEKGEYLAVTINDWRTKTDSIKVVFHAMMQYSCADNSKPCVEWYKSNEEMLCMIRTHQ